MSERVTGAAKDGSHKKVGSITLTTSDNTASPNRFSCARCPKGKRACMSLWREHVDTEHPSSQSARASPQLSAN